MATRRMYSKTVTDSDAFVKLSAPAQALYLHLNQAADDDGFTNQLQMSMLKAHAKSTDLKQLIDKGFLIKFNSGVVAVSHWRINNNLRKDRYTPTNFQAEFCELYTVDSVYFL